MAIVCGTTILADHAWAMINGRRVRIALHTAAPAPEHTITTDIDWTRGADTMSKHDKHDIAAAELLDELPHDTILRDKAGRLWVRYRGRDGWDMIYTPNRGDGETWQEVGSPVLAELGPLRAVTAKGSRSDLVVMVGQAQEAVESLQEQLAEARREAAHARSAADTAGRTLQAMSEAQEAGPDLNAYRLDVERLTAERDQAQASADRALDAGAQYRAEIDQLRAAMTRERDHLRFELQAGASNRDELAAEIARLHAERDDAVRAGVAAIRAEKEQQEKLWQQRTRELMAEHERRMLLRSADVQAKQDSIDILKDQRAELRQEVTELGRQLADTAAQLGRIKAAWQTWRDTIGALDAE